MDVNDLESAINSAKESTASEAGDSQMSEEQEIGFHKGAVSTLSAERNELIKMVGNVEAIMKMHISRLKELGVN